MKIEVKRWLSSFKKYFFSYNEGFFELPFLANSPQVIVDSFSSMPFMKNHPNQGYFTANNLFIYGEGHYQKIEEGFWLIMSDMQIKRDLSFKLYYLPDEPKDYHSLTLYINKTPQEIQYPKLEINIDNLDRSWTLHKAGAKSLNSHFKGQHSIFLTFYFNNDWMQSHFGQDGKLKSKRLQQFFDSKNEFLFLSSLLESDKALYEALVDDFLDKDESGVKNLLLLKSKAYALFNAFVLSLDKVEPNGEGLEISEIDKRRLSKVVHLLNQSIFDDFPSIPYLAKQAGISETKLKQDFKSLYGCTLYQFYLGKQMQYAYQILKYEQVSIKEVALSLGYQNSSKFSKAFQRTYGKLPSEV